MVYRMMKIWQDRHIKKYIYIILLSTLFGTFLYLGYDTLFSFELTLGYFSIILILAFSLLFLLHIFRVKLSYIDSNGIRIGNAPDDSYEKFKLNQKIHYIEWSQINNIKIKGRGIKRPTHMDVIDILTVNIKDNQKYESFIADPKGFLKALKSLKKDKLVAEDSKYVEVINKLKNKF